MFERLKTKVRNFREGYRREGSWYVLHAIMWRVPSWLFYYNHSVLAEAVQPKLITRQYKNYTVEAADADDIDSIARLEGFRREKIVSRLEAGDTCYMVKKNGLVVATSWGRVGKLFSVDSGARIDTGDDAYFLYGLFTAPDERGKGLHVSCLKANYEHYVKAGRKRAIGIIHFGNVASIKTHQSMNFVVSGETCYLRLLGISVCYYKKWPHKRNKLEIMLKVPPAGFEWV
ncbi:MAG: hypothetical protein AB1483_00925 [Candidatus Zixiibacteriota bacterium]